MKIDPLGFAARPWADSIRTRSGRAVMALALLSAPLALAAGLWLQQRNSAGFLPKITINRAQALEAAHKIAKENGYESRGWQAFVTTRRNEMNELFLRARAAGGEGRPPGSRFGGKDRPRRPGEAEERQPPDERKDSKGGPGETEERQPPDERRDSMGRPGPPDERDQGKARTGPFGRGLTGPNQAPGPGTVPARGMHFTPPVEVTVLLVEPGGRVWNRVEMGVDGFVTVFEAGGSRLVAPARSSDGVLERQTAEAALKQWLGDTALDRLGEPEASLTEESAVTEANRFVWRVLPRFNRMLELEFTFDVAGGKILKREVRPRYTGEFLANTADPERTRRQYTGLAEMLLIAGMSLYAFYRYTRRTIEKEAPHGRTAALVGIAVLSGIVILASDPYSMIRGLGPENMAGPLFYAGLLFALMFFSVPGLIMGIAYGSGEGEIREMYPAKLTSLDCLLKGKIFAQNTGAAVAGGVMISVWIFLAFHVVQAVGGAGWTEYPTAILTDEFGRIPRLRLLAGLPMRAILATVVGLLVPLTFLRRHVTNRKLFIVLLVAAAVVGSGFSEGIDPKVPADWLVACALTTTLLIPFFRVDYLASLVSLVTFQFLHKAGILYAVSEYWRQSAPWLGALALAAVALFVWAAWRGRKIEDQEVRPVHARNLMLRLSFEAEMHLAREAQMRLLPPDPPDIEGLTIAASCTPSGEVGGDFYDFYRLPGNRLGTIVAEGGNDGLAAALTIAMAKGFLMYEAEMPATVAETMQRLEQELGRHLKRSSAQSGLGLIVADPQTGSIQVMRTGRYPEALVLGAEGIVRPSSWHAVEGSNLESSELSLETGDRVLFYTDGLPKLAGQKAEGGITQLLARAGTQASAAEARHLHEGLLQLLLGQQTELQDDLTLVILQYAPTASQRGERAA